MTDTSTVQPISPAHHTYAELNRLLSRHKNQGDVSALGQAVSKMLQDKSFNDWIAKDPTVPKSVASEGDCHIITQRYLYRILYARDYAGAALLLWGPDIFDPRPRFSRLIFNALSKNALVNAMGCASAGKCLGIDTPVLMFDGSVVKVQDIKAGDVLMGDDSTPRNVLSLARGRETLFKVIPSHGDTWVCNKSHILSLKCSEDRKTRHGRLVRGRSKGDVKDVCVSDVLSMSKSARKLWKQYRVGVEFSNTKSLPVDPYCYVTGTKRILPEYLHASRSDRLQLLAGILDGDGYADDGSFEISAKDKGFADDVTYLARSLGFYASNSTVGEYQNIYISGCVDLIPNKQKLARVKKSNRNPMLQELEFEDLGIGDYYGFEIDGNHRFLLGDFTVTHNTYSGVAYSLLDWILDPEWTSILLVGPDSDHLRRNMFGDLVRLHEGSVIQLPGRADTESLSTDKRRGMGFFTVALDRGPAASAKLKGAKTKPRSGNDHPLFGRSSRLRIFIDEAQQVPVNAWSMLINAISNKESDEHLKVFCAANPSDESSVYGKNCKPVNGWSRVEATQESWMSETGWAVVRLNAMLSENVQARKTIFPRLINYEKVQAIIRAAGGDDQSPDVYTQVYGMFPPTGSKAAVVKASHVESSKGEFIFTGGVTHYLSFDPAYTGDRPAVASGRYGMAGGWMDYDGVITKYDTPMQAIQIDSCGVIARGDTQDMADEVFLLAKSLGVQAECFGIDRTGIGQGCHDIIRRQWGKSVAGTNADVSDILGICYSERASETKVLDEDTDTPLNMYDNTASELWYAAGRLFERGVIKIGKAVEKTAIDELVNRRGGRISGKARKLGVETKDSYKARGNSSPDFADAITMLIHTIRLREDFNPKAAKTPEVREQDQWNGAGWLTGHGFVGEAPDFGDEGVKIDMKGLMDMRD